MKQNEFWILFLILIHSTVVFLTQVDDGSLVFQDYSAKSLNGNTDESVSIHIPITFQQIESCQIIEGISTCTALFIYHPLLNPNTVESEVLKFCVQYAVFRSDCIEIFREALRLLREAGIQTNSVGGAGHNVTASIYPVSSAQEAVDSQRVSAFRLMATSNLTGSVVSAAELETERRIDSLILEDFQSRLASVPPSAPARVVFVHSVWLAHSGPRVLLELLELIEASGLAAELQGLWVLNYGLDVSQGGERLLRFPGARLLQRSGDPSFFEVPTLRHLAHFSRAVAGLRPPPPPLLASETDTQVLYLHTKGVSYARPHPPIADWTRLMLFFAVERHRACLHLLASGEVRATGVDYSHQPANDSQGTACFAGNMWWAAAAHLQTLPPPDWLSGKYVPEHWLFSQPPGPPFHCFHVADVIHYTQRYPRSRYTALPPLTPLMDD